LATILILSCTENTPKLIPTETQLPEPTSCNCDDLIMDAKYNWFYLNDRKKPFEGICTKTNRDGAKLLERHYTTGKVNGSVSEWFANGQQRLSMEFEMNMQIGEMKEWTEDGELEYHALYDYGKLDTLLFKRVHYVTQ
ncbi:MAG: hypothetical protein JKY54_19595, partial [Flavobacteriales bacterium]|nr:hypothetical protein [Flavobacteriales bacterium]